MVPNITLCRCFKSRPAALSFSGDHHLGCPNNNYFERSWYKRERETSVRAEGKNAWSTCRSLAMDSFSDGTSSAAVSLYSRRSLPSLSEFPVASSIPCWSHITSRSGSWWFDRWSRSLKSHEEEENGGMEYRVWTDLLETFNILPYSPWTLYSYLIKFHSFAI